MRRSVVGIVTALAVTLFVGALIGGAVEARILSPDRVGEVQQIAPIVAELSPPDVTVPLPPEVPSTTQPAPAPTAPQPVTPQPVAPQPPVNVDDNDDDDDEVDDGVDDDDDDD